MLECIGPLMSRIRTSADVFGGVECQPKLLAQTPGAFEIDVLMPDAEGVSLTVVDSLEPVQRVTGSCFTPLDGKAMTPSRSEARAAEPPHPFVARGLSGGLTERIIHGARWLDKEMAPFEGHPPSHPRTVTPDDLPFGHTMICTSPMHARDHAVELGAGLR